MNSKLEAKIDLIKSKSIEELCEMYDCKPEEICMDDYIAHNTEDTVCPYKVILGFANFEGSNVTSLGNLEVVFGRKLADCYGLIFDKRHQPIYLGLNLKNSKITNTGRLKAVYGGLTLNQNITTLGNIEFLGSNLYVVNSNLFSFGNCTTIDGILNLEDDEQKCQVYSLENLRKVRRLFLNTNCLYDLAGLEEVKEIRLGSKCNFRIRQLIENNFKLLNGKYVRRDLIINQD